MVGGYGSRYENLGYTLDLLEFNCVDKIFRLLEVTDYSKGGEVLNSIKDDTAKLRFIPPDSITEVLYKAVCK